MSNIIAFVSGGKDTIHMKAFRKFVWSIPIIQIILIVTIILGFHVDDMTLTKGQIDDFNNGWTLVREDGSVQEIDSLPYSEDCKAGRTVIAQNTIPKKYWGKTLSFLSADKTLKVCVDGQLIYEFGLNDHRFFGHTPGSVTNFIDIPADLTKGRITIEMTSPYDNYAASISKMTIADRDISILNLIEKNFLNAVCCIIILFCGIVFFILTLIQKISKQRSNGMEYLCIFSFVGFIYYAIETKTLNVFWGNQTLYSNLIFLILMLFPLFLLMYYEQIVDRSYKKIFYVLLSLATWNIIAQLILQVYNCIDFMNMAVFSHGMIFLTAITILILFYQMARKNPGVDVMLEFFALFFLILGSVIDLVRTYVVKIGDLGKFSRYGMTVFCLIMVVEHVRNISKRYSRSLEENAKLLQREVERQTHVAKEQEAKIERLSYQIIMAMVTAIDAKDCYTNGHSLRVARYSRELARRLGMSEQKQQDIYYMGLLHDIGKIGIPDEIINKPGKLSEEEYETIKKHPMIGANILKNISEMPGIEVGAGSHHERYDGQGYPSGKSGEDIPYIARIICVADAYDAMSSRRSYRDVLPQEVVREEIAKGKGKQFDPDIADQMIDMIDQDIHYEMREVDY